MTSKLIGSLDNLLIDRVEVVGREAKLATSPVPADIKCELRKNDVPVRSDGSTSGMTAPVLSASTYANDQHIDFIRFAKL